MNPTQEQSLIIDAARRGRHIAINAFAGAGKTTTLAMIAQALPRKRIVYLAFNKAIAEEAKRRMPPNVDARTFHSLAWRAMRPDNARLRHRMHGGFVADRLRLTGMRVNTLLYYPSQVGRAVLATVGRYCISKDAAVNASHVPPPSAMLPNTAAIPDSLRDLMDKDSPERAAYRDTVLEKARELWSLMAGGDASIPITHDTYVKQWSLGAPRIDADIILFDEAQDASGLFIDIVGRQRHAQRIWVGDRHQQIYEWRDAINALDLVEVDERLHLTESWRFHQGIADRANIVLKALGENRSLVGRGGARTDSGKAFLCRTNTGAFETYVSLLKQEHLVRLENAGELLALIDDCQALIDGNPRGALALFKDWHTLLEHAESPQGRDLKPIVEAIAIHGCDGLRAMLQKGMMEKAPVTVCTMHRAKGLEWDEVQIIDDWSRIKDYRERVDERRLLYVALTRARTILDPGTLGDGWLEKLAEETRNVQDTNNIRVPSDRAGSNLAAERRRMLT